LNEIIHAHEIIRLIHNADSLLTRGELREKVTDCFGEHARFHACVDGSMSLDQVLEFLARRGKVIEVDGYLRTDIGLMCNHEN